MCGSFLFHYHLNLLMATGLFSEYQHLSYMLLNRAMTKGAVWRGQRATARAITKSKWLLLCTVVDYIICQMLLAGMLWGLSRSLMEIGSETPCQHLAFISCQQFVKHGHESCWKWVPLSQKTSNDGNPGQNRDYNVLTSPNLINPFIGKDNAQFGPGMLGLGPSIRASLYYGQPLSPKAHYSLASVFSPLNRWQRRLSNLQ